jgi:hypothetical protein
MAVLSIFVRQFGNPRPSIVLNVATRSKEDLMQVVKGGLSCGDQPMLQIKLNNTLTIGLAPIFNSK